MDDARISTMLIHVVQLRFHTGTPSEHLDGVVEQLRELPDSVPSIRRYEVGRDMGLDQGNADIVVTGEFDGPDGYREYSGHPAHRRVIEESILPHLETRTATQYERQA